MRKSRLATWSSILTPIMIVGLIGCGSPAPRPTTVQSSTVEQAETDAALAERESRFSGQDENRPFTKPAKIKPKARKYTVKKGDTLWDISSVFLKDPWYWPEIWSNNEQLQNPHLIYPGDVLTLVYVRGEPKVMVTESPMRKIKASPKIRRSALDASIPVIPGDAIRQFITKPRVVTEEELEKAPYIVNSDDEHLVLSKEDRVYIRGELDKERVRYTVFRPNKKLIDPTTEELLGYEAVYAGEVRIDDYGDPATGILTYTEREVLIGDRLLPIDKSQDTNLFHPRYPEDDIKANIVSLFDALFGVAKFQIAVINQGARDGLQVGHVLAAYRKGNTINDRYTHAGMSSTVTMPDEVSGMIMVFRTFDEVSYALVMESTNVIHNGDVVRTPR